jgi:hypothetical protein
MHTAGSLRSTAIGSGSKFDLALLPILVVGFRVNIAVPAVAVFRANLRQIAH